MRMNFSVVIPALLACCTLSPAQQAQPRVVKENTMEIRKMTPNLYTDDVEACVKFWVDRLHFQKTMEVPDGPRLAFAALQKGSIELMYGSYASLGTNNGVAEAYRRGTSFLFIEVGNLDEVLAAMKGAPIVTPVHKTFYGSTEFTVADPAGHLITFAQFGKA